ncbi:MAG: hypothetical protein SNJ35_04230 [Rikenellaceae bacterium]
MKHKYLIISILIIALIVIFQTAFICTLYDNFRIECTNNLEETFFSSINKEYRSRLYNISDKLLFKPIDEMSEARRDSLLNIAPLPQNPPKLDVEDLIKKGVIRTSAEIGQQYNQDIYYDSGKEIDLSKLDSIFIAMSNVDYPHTLALIDNIKNTTTTTDLIPLTNYTYKSKPFYIGIQARQTIFIY